MTIEWRCLKHMMTSIGMGGLKWFPSKRRYLKQQKSHLACSHDDSDFSKLISTGTISLFPVKACLSTSSRCLVILCYIMGPTLILAPDCCHSGQPVDCMGRSGCHWCLSKIPNKYNLVLYLNKQKTSFCTDYFTWLKLIYLTSTIYL